MKNDKYNITFSITGQVTDEKQIASVLKQIANDIDNNRLKLQSNSVKVERHSEKLYCIDKECLCEVLYSAVEYNPDIQYGE